MSCRPHARRHRLAVVLFLAVVLGAPGGVVAQLVQQAPDALERSPYLRAVLVARIQEDCRGGCPSSWQVLGGLAALDMTELRQRADTARRYALTRQLKDACQNVASCSGAFPTVAGFRTDGALPSFAELANARSTLIEASGGGAGFFFVDPAAGLSEGGEGAGTSGAAGLFSLTSGIPAADLAEGVGRFLMERARDEVAFALVQSIASIDPSKQPDLPRLVPSTWNVLRSGTPQGYRGMLGLLRSAFKADLRNLPTNLGQKLVLWCDATPARATGGTGGGGAETPAAGGTGEGGPEQPTPGAGSRNDAAPTACDPPESIRFASDVGALVAGLDMGTHPVAAFAALKRTAKPSVGDPVRIRVWVVASIAEAVGDAALGLPLPGGGTAKVPLSRLLASTQPRQAFINALVSEAGPAWQGEVRDLLDHHVREALSLAHELEAIAAALDQARQTADTTLTPTQRRAALVEGVQKVMAAARPLLDPEGKAADALRGMDWTLEVWRALEASDIHTAVRLALEELSSVKPVSKDVNRLLAVGSALASVDDPEELAEALNAVVSPVGSWRARRAKDGGASYALVAYVGGHLGDESLKGLPSALAGDNATVAGLFAPIGLEISHPMPWGSVGLMVSAFDLGAVASYRTSETTAAEDGETVVQTTPRVGFAELVAPGAFAVLGVSRAFPLTVGGGVQFVPGLRRLEGPDGTRSASAVRWLLFAGVDITLIPF